MHFDFQVAWESLPKLLAGTATTFAVLLPVLVIGLLLAIPVALACFRPGARSVFAGAYIGFFRGVPSLVLLYLIYSGLPQFPIVRETFLWKVFSNAYVCAWLGLALTHSGYLAEIIRGGLAAVPKGTLEAAETLGLKPRQILFRLRLPLVARYIIRAYQNELLIMVKSTAAVSAITLVDLTAAANTVFDYTYDPFTPLITAAAIYWCITNSIRLGFSAADRKLNRYLVKT
ncbi:ABC transporter permease [Bordetella pseudohinzii]|uniref:Arginine transport system permease protein ArtQ n=1 Tax=Bordetella pseudohinzii TaxID=1331258 RepID=A0A0J6BRK9_9BORD|nr:ABC transporter permease subunit [Bordetella pseudohinzii]ANY17256.1 arginine transporter [Bordetella pseudohinzii]KMM24469.1 arginine transporter [Bordetella pseudohinzii]KXA80492.1 arginine transporter [Bordetella pseudohinzii]KXA80713.1 arginine transporter [Bordetella pseudohinzii]CUI67610.1 Arginine transport system permease protein ArtQ [Bordetella pseudohinzii]